MINELETLRARVEEISKLVGPLITERAALEEQIRELRSPFKVGDMIEWTEGIRRGRVERIRVWVCGDLMWEVRRTKKDGSDGGRVLVRPYQDPKKVV